MRRSRWRLALSFLLLGLVSALTPKSDTLAQDNRPLAREIVVERNIAYRNDENADSRRHILDIYAPADVQDYPVLFFVHGGAWVSGSKDELANLGRAFAEQGIGVVLANYRLSPGVTHPAHIEDISAAYAWTVAHIAAYGGNPDQIIVGGHSAGGHLTSLMTLDPQYLAAVNLTADGIRGVLNVSTVWWIDDWIVQWARGAFPVDDAGRQAASPITYLQALAPAKSKTANPADVPPFLVLVTENDYPELIDEADVAVSALDAAGVAYEFHPIAGRDHYSVMSLIGNPDDEATRIMLAWMQSIFEPGNPE